MFDWLGEMFIEIFLELPGAMVYKYFLRRPGTLKEIILKGPAYLSLMGAGLLVVICFMGYGVYVFFQKLYF